MVDIGHAHPLRMLLDGIHALLLRANEEHRPAAAGEVAGEIVSLLEQTERLLQVDDVDAAALREDEALHLRVPAAGLVAEVDAGLQQLSHRDDGQGRFLSGFGYFPTGTS